MRREHKPMFHMPKNWCEIEVRESDIGPYIKAFHEQDIITLPHGQFFPVSYWISRCGRTEIYCRPVPKVWEQSNYVS